MAGDTIGWRARTLRWVGRVPILSSLLRRIARNFPEGSVVQIGSGLGKGLHWRRHKRYVNGYWLGHYELPIQEALHGATDANQTVFDVGANAGFFALLCARFVGTGGRVVAFDPDPDNAASIEDQAQLNALAQVEVVCAAVSNEIGTATFARASVGDSMGHLGSASSSEESFDVATTTLDDAAKTYGMPHVVKVDVEGAEGLVLAGAATLIASGQVTWLLELHGPSCEADAKAALIPAGYTFTDIAGATLAGDAPWPSHVLAHPAQR